MNWITINEKHAPRINTVYFKNIYEYSGEGLVEMEISATGRYCLYINGVAAAFGPCRGDYFTHYYEKIDITPFLEKGDNVFAVKTVTFPPKEEREGNERGPDWLMLKTSIPGLYAKCIAKDEKSIKESGTGMDKWYYLLDNAVSWRTDPISLWLGAMEVVDGLKIPYGWEKDFDITNWNPAKNLWDTGVNPWGEISPFPLKERTIPLLPRKPKSFINEMPQKSDSLSRFTFTEGKAVVSSNTKKIAVLDAGELTTGFFKLRVKGGKGSKIKILYSECYSKKDGIKNIKDKRDDFENGTLTGHFDIYCPSGGEDFYEPFWLRTFRYIQIEVETKEEELLIYTPTYDETGYPLDIQTEVLSKEEWINYIWDISIRTLKRCMHEAYEDCPYYEQLQYTSDTRLQMLFTYMISNDTRLAEKAMFDFHSSMLPEGMIQSRYPSENPQVIPAFSLYFIMMVHDYYWKTGDKGLVKKYRPTIDSILEWFDRKINAEGLLEKLEYWDFADWVDEWSHIHGCPKAVLHGPSSIHNLQYAYALKIAAFLNEATGRKGVADEYVGRSENIINKVNETCFDKTKGMYREGPDFYEYSEHAQVWGTLSGAINGDTAKTALLNAIKGKNIARCSFPLQFYLFRALEKADAYDETEKLWDKWKDMQNYNLTTIPEIPDNARSDCHAWGSLALYEFTAKFLGINPLEPGYKKIQIEPKGSFVNDLSGSVVTPFGKLDVKVARDKSGLTISGNIPAGIYTVIKYPDGKEIVYENGGKF